MEDLVRPNGVIANPVTGTAPPRPNYNLIHAQPLPLKVYSLPTLIPHNPLSVLSIALTYFIQLLSRANSHPAQPYTGIFSTETRSVHITDEPTVRALWESGFFGKGSLSRSEPSWLEREKRRRGLIVGETSEEVTRRRREERKEFKRERARKEREAIEKRIHEEKEISVENGDVVTKEVRTAPETASLEPQNGNISVHKRDSPSLEDPSPNGKGSQDSASAADESPLISFEHLQLTLEEAFFLSYGLGILTVKHPDSHLPLPQHDLLLLFRGFATFPPEVLPPLTPPPNDTFLSSYVVYHHFRSLGWVVRPGIKFGVDYLLYNRGPVFSHAEFAVVIVPSYSDAYWKSQTGKVDLARAGVREKGKAWWWLHMVNRVQSQVRKTLVVAFVEVPSSFPLGEADGAPVDVTATLKRYRVREMVLQRWVPNRTRD